MIKLLSLTFLLCFLLDARENPFFPADGENDMPLSSNILQKQEPLKRATLTFPSTARTIEELTVTFKNLDGSIEKKSITLNNSIDWHLPLFISQNYDLSVVEKADKKKKPERFRPVFFSSNAITLSDKIQLINRFYGEPESIHDTFDFLHTFNYWRSDSKELVLNVDALEAILDKRLVYKGSRYPLCSVIRVRKFLKRGWTINAGQILKMCYQLSELDLSDIEVLEDQLIGVDTAYFSDLISRIQLEISSNEDFKIDETVVAKLVDEIFG